MEQEGGNMNMMNNNRQASQQQGSRQKCPRCDSQNTKFCYYNNYSFAQPRYFCKTCRRYWTQGGTLRNVPVGGGGRAGKKAKNSSSSSSSSSSVARQQPLTAAVRGTDSSVAAVPYGGGGGYFSSLAAIHHNPLNQSSQSQYFNPHQSMMMSSSSNMGLLSGLNFTAAGSSVQRQFRPSPFYSGEREQTMSLYGAGQGAGLVPSQNIWPQTRSFTNNSNSVWSTISTTSSISQPQRNASAASASASANASSSSFFNNQWHDLSGYNPHP